MLCNPRNYPDATGYYLLEPNHNAKVARDFLGREKYLTIVPQRNMVLVY
jgi:hypothetical protein